MEEFIYISSHIELFGALFADFFESNVVDEINYNLHHQPWNVDLPPQKHDRRDQV